MPRGKPKYKTEERVRWLRKNRGKWDFGAEEDRAFKAAVALKDAGLYSKSTYIEDIKFSAARMIKTLRALVA